MKIPKAESMDERTERGPGSDNVCIVLSFPDEETLEVLVSK